MSRRVEIPTAALEEALIAERGFLQSVARRLGVSRSAVYRRSSEAGLLKLAANLRIATGWKGGAPPAPPARSSKRR
jgi:AraC-like DNA-binding protein